MAITDTEQMEALMTAHIRCQCVSVLVHLVRVTWLVTTGCGEGEFGYGVEALLSHMV